VDAVDDLLEAPEWPPRRPVPPPKRRRRARRRRSGRQQVVRGLAVIVAAIALPLALGVVVFDLMGPRDEPAAVPAGYAPPDDRPRSAAPLSLSEMVFDSDREGAYDLYVRGADGVARRLTGDPAYESWRPRLSPDRRTVAFYRTPASSRGRDPATAGLWAVPVDGSAPPVLLRPAGYDGWVVQSGVSWSPDGEHLLMAGGRRDATQLWLTDARGQGPTPVAPDPGQARADPVFSPAGDAVTFIGCPADDCDDGREEVYRAPLDGGPAVRLTQDDRTDRDPAFSPDGKWLAWRSQIRSGLSESWDVIVADAGGGWARRMLGDDGIAGPPRWSPDGRTIVLDRQGPSRATASLWAIPADSTGGAGGQELTPDQHGNSELPSP
jgi:Tol biopolymer transport system component